jgi:hypothetical protein
MFSAFSTTAACVNEAEEDTPAVVIAFARRERALCMDTHNAGSFRSIQVLRGPNLYAHMPVLHIILDIGPYENQPSSHWPGCVERLTGWLPGLATHGCSPGRPGGFIERLERGVLQRVLNKPYFGALQRARISPFHDEWSISCFVLAPDIEAVYCSPDTEYARCEPH